MEPKGSSPHSQQPMACPCSEPINPVNAPFPISLKFVLILSFHLCLGLPSSLFLSGFPTKNYSYIYISQTDPILSAGKSQS